MAVATQSGIPESFTAGDTVIFTVGAVAAYPIATWGASIVFNVDGIPKLSKTATVSDGNYLFTLSKDNTRALPAGLYDVAIYATDGAERVTLASGQLYAIWRNSERCCCWPYALPAWQIRVLPNLQDERPATKAEQMLAACEAAMLTLATSPYSSTSFSGQSWTMRDMGQLMTQHARLQSLVNAERARLAGGRDINIYPVFA